MGLSDANVSKKELSGDTEASAGICFRCASARTLTSTTLFQYQIEGIGFKPMYSLDGIQELIKGYTMIHNRKYGNV